MARTTKRSPMPTGREFTATMSGACTNCELGIQTGEHIVKGAGRYDYHHKVCPQLPATTPVDAQWLFGAERHASLVRTIEVLDAVHDDYRTVGLGHCKSYEGMVRLTVLKGTETCSEIKLASYLYASGRSEDFADSAEFATWMEENYSEIRRDNIDLEKFGYYGENESEQYDEAHMEQIAAAHSTLPETHQDIRSSGLPLVDPVTAGQLAEIGRLHLALAAKEAAEEITDPEMEPAGRPCRLTINLSSSWSRLSRADAGGERTALCHKDDIEVVSGKVFGTPAQVLTALSGTR